MLLCGVLQCFVVVGEARLAGRLGSVEGKVGSLQDIQGFAIVVQWRDTDAGADHQGTTVHVQRLVQVVEDALGYLLGVAVAGEVVKQDDEFVAAEAEQLISRAQGLFQADCHFHQHAITDVVAEAIVDQLEAVQIDEQQRLVVTALALLPEGLLHLLVKPDAVGQAGQRVVLGGMLEALLGILACTDIGLRASHA
ncbi:hypothetical protein D3C75_763840 [compost metagenome]